MVVGAQNGSSARLRARGDHDDRLGPQPALPLSTQAPHPPRHADRQGRQAARGYLRCLPGLFEAVSRNDLEGIVAKRAGAPYTPEKPTWVKIKSPTYSEIEEAFRAFLICARLQCGSEDTCRNRLGNSCLAHLLACSARLLLAPAKRRSLPNCRLARRQRLAQLRPWDLRCRLPPSPKRRSSCRWN